MDNNIKISLTIYLEGGTLVRKSKPDFINWVTTKKDLYPMKHFKNKEGLQVVKSGSIPHYSYEVKPATQHIDMSVEAYNYMISKECPYWINPKEWNRMGKKAKLEAQLKRTCEYLGGNSFEYEVLED